MEGTMAKNTFPFIHRDLSWIEFNKRVLAEAQDTTLPLLERAMVLSFVVSNKDEFFMVRLASHYNERLSNKSKDKKNNKSLVGNLQKKLLQMDKEVNECFSEICNALKTENIIIHHNVPKDHQSKNWAKEIFKTQLSALLTPIAIFPTRPMPLVKGKSLHMAVMFDDSPNAWATLKLPETMPRLLRLPSNDEQKHYICLEAVIQENIQLIFTGKKVRYAMPYRILRDAEAAFTDEETGDFLSSIRQVLQARKRGKIMRLELPHNAPQELIQLLSTAFAITNKEVYKQEKAIELVSLLRGLYNIEGYEHLKYPKYTPYLPPGLDNNNLFASIAEKDHLLFHPYDSFSPVVELIRQAAQDPAVQSIKQTLYRVSGNSPIIAALLAAAKAGKQVTVFIELKARFDEQNNILWGEMMEHAACQVIYGLPGLKTHSKITLITRQEAEEHKHYLHLGTGNYHDGTAKSYTDLSLFTANQKLGNDAVQFFHILTGYGKTSGMNSLITAPDTLRKKLTTLIAHEAELALQGVPSSITAKMNALVDPAIVEALYKANQAGVKIRLIVRSACSLVPGIPDISENICVTSIVGRHLEHARIFRFENAGEPLYYASSADWMPRNLDKRVELMFPIKDQSIQKRIDNILRVQMCDTEKSWLMLPSGKYERVRTWAQENKVNAQEIFMQSNMLRNNIVDIVNLEDIASEYLQKLQN